MARSFINFYRDRSFDHIDTRCVLFTSDAGAALVGLAAAPLWTAKATYLNHLARHHAQHKKQTPEVSISLFFGIFFAFFGTNTVWGNLISYFVLNQSSAAQVFNCGVHFNPQSAFKTNATQDVSDTTVSSTVVCITSHFFVGFAALYSLRCVHRHGTAVHAAPVLRSGFRSIDSEA